MAVAGELHLLGWDEWNKELLEKRRRRWKEALRDRGTVTLLKITKLRSDEEEDRKCDEEEEDTGSGREGKKGENEAGVVREQKKEDEVVMREAEEMEEEGEHEVGKEVKEDEVVEEDESVDLEEDEVEDEEEKEVMEEDERVDVEEDGVERGVMEDEVEEAEEREAMKEDERVDVEEDEVGTVVMEDEDEEEEAEEREVMEAEEIEEEQEEKEFQEVEEPEECEEGLNEVADDVDEEVREEEQVEEEDDGEEEHQEQEQIGQYHLTEQFGEHSRRTEEENIWQNQESAEAQEEENLSESVDSDEEESDEEESDEEESDVTESEDESSDSDGIKNEEEAVENHRKDPEELDDPDEKSLRTSHGRKEEEDETLALEKETFAESLTIQEEEFQGYQEEESAYAEEGDSTDEEADSDDEEVVKTFHKNGYHKDIFRTLTEFKDSSILTDLTLRTADGKSFFVHSPVLAAVSSHVRENISRRIVNKRKDTDVGLQRWSLYLGPEVEEVGLQAVVEFAYTGLISCLSRNTLQRIKAAAQSFGAPRVLNLCKESPKYQWQKKDKRLTASEQINISFKSINQLWMDRVGCDVILEAVGGTFRAHRVILAVCSDYFRSMFTLEMRESNQSCVTLPFILAPELEAMICSSYSGTLPLSWKCIYETTCTAHQLQCKPAIALCHDFFQQEMTPHYCLDVASFAEAYDLRQILEVADDFVLRQFSKVVCTAKFKDLPGKQLLKYLNSRSLFVQSELVVFKAVVKWIQARPKVRLRLAKDLMKTIHFPLMTFKEFKEVQTLDMWSEHQLADLYEAIFWDFCSNESQCRVYVPKENLVLIGGDQISEDLGTRTISGDLWFGNSLRNHTGVKKAMEWRKLGEMPKPERFCHEVAVFEGQLYVLGGKSYYGTSDNLSCVHRYDPLQNSWESLAEMQEKRSSFSAVVLDGKVYAFGGQGDREYIKSVERYCPTAKSWSFVRPLDLPLGGHVAKVFQGQIFISGGLSDDNLYLASMILYDPEKGSTFLSTMANPRARHCMETLGEYLYVAGGITANKNMNIIDHLACEVYNPAADSWTAITSLPVPHVGAAGAVLEGKFYVLGGYSQDDYNDMKMVHRYDPTAQKWENMGKMPGPNNDIRATLLCLPSHCRL